MGLTEFGFALAVLALATLTSALPTITQRAGRSERHARIETLAAVGLVLLLGLGETALLWSVIDSSFTDALAVVCSWPLALNAGLVLWLTSRFYRRFRPAL